MPIYKDGFSSIGDKLHRGVPVLNGIVMFILYYRRKYLATSRVHHTLWNKIKFYMSHKLSPKDAVAVFRIIQGSDPHDALVSYLEM